MRARLISPRSLALRLRAFGALVSFWLRQPSFLFFFFTLTILCAICLSDMFGSGGSLRKILVAVRSGTGVVYPLAMFGAHCLVVIALAAGALIRVATLMGPAARSPKGAQAKQRYQETMDRARGLDLAQKEAEALSNELGASRGSRAAAPPVSRRLPPRL
jgi:hypothetical protein